FRQSFPTFGPRHASQCFVVVLQSCADRYVGNRLALSPRQHGLGAPGGRLRNLHCRALFCDAFDGLLFIEFRPTSLHITRHGGQWQPWLSNHRRQRTPFFSQGILLHSRRHAHPLRFYFRFQHFRFVGLAGIHQFSLRLRGIFRNLRQVPPPFQPFLRRQYAQESHLHGGCDARALLLRFNLRELGFHAKDLAALTKLSSRHDGLLHKESLLASSDRAASYLIPGVPDGRIGVESYLLLPRLCSANFRLRLTQRWICLSRHLFHLL